MRNRVRAIDNIEILDGHDAVELLMRRGLRGLSSVLVADRKWWWRPGDSRRLDSSTPWVARDGLPAFLESAGFGRPAGGRYRRAGGPTPANCWSFGDNVPWVILYLVGAVGERPCGGSLFAYENDTWLPHHGRDGGPGTTGRSGPG